MLIAMIRPLKTSTVEVIGTTLEDVQTQIRAKVPDGWRVRSARSV